jgi:hypothetical protein
VSADDRGDEHTPFSYAEGPVRVRAKCRYRATSGGNLPPSEPPIIGGTDRPRRVAADLLDVRLTHETSPGVGAHNLDVE